VKVVPFLNGLGIGGTEKAACRWARGLRDRGHRVVVVALRDGPRRRELEAHDIEVRTVADTPAAIAALLRELQPEIIHAHAPGNPHEGDVLGEALATLPKIPVVQTNIFGRFNNPREDRWTDFRLFISWTSCVQSARRSFRKLDEAFFRRASVAGYPLDADDGPGADAAAEFRAAHGVRAEEVLFGRLSRPEPNKWTDLPLEGFRRAACQHPRIKLLLREPPPEVARTIESAPDRERFLILPATADAAELARTIAALDVVLHTSIIGESFGYGIAEPMNQAKPVIANSTPWQDQAQIELVRHGECGFIASTPATVAESIVALAGDPALRQKLGREAQRHIRQLANPATSLDRLEAALAATCAGRDNPRGAEDLLQARRTADYLDAHQFGQSLGEQCALRPFHYRVRFHEWRKRYLSARPVTP